MVRPSQRRAANINRPSLMGAMVMKSAAYDNTTDSYRDRHLIDLGVLANLVGAVDAEGFAIKNNERKRLLKALRDLKIKSGLINSIDGALEGVLRVELMLESIR